MIALLIIKTARGFIAVPAAPTIDSSRLVEAMVADEMGQSYSYSDHGLLGLVRKYFEDKPEKVEA